MIDFDIRDGLLHFSFSLNRRLNFIIGNSATGKSSMYELLTRKLTEDDEGVILTCNIRVMLLDFSTLGFIPEDLQDVVFVVDDLDILGNKDFLRLHDSMVERNFWFVIMSREEVPSTYKNTLTFSTSCLFRMTNIGNNYSLSPLYDIDSSTSNKYDSKERKK